MDLTRELAPVALGLVLPPVIALGVRSRWLSHTKFFIAFFTAVILGAATSYAAGELVVGLQDPNAWLAILIETSLIFTASQVSYYLLWKPFFGLWRRPERATERLGKRPRKEP
jgi:hypothetical protein